MTASSQDKNILKHFISMEIMDWKNTIFSKTRTIFYTFSPYSTCFVILLNSYLIASKLGIQMTLQLIIFLICGMPLYFGYSYSHSKLRKQRKLSSMHVKLRPQYHSCTTPSNSWSVHSLNTDEIILIRVSEKYLFTNNA